MFYPSESPANGNIIYAHAFLEVLFTNTQTVLLLGYDKRIRWYLTLFVVYSEVDKSAGLLMWIDYSCWWSVVVDHMHNIHAIVRYR